MEPPSKTLTVLYLPCCYLPSPVIRSLSTGLPPRLRQLILDISTISKRLLGALFEAQLRAQLAGASSTLERITLINCAPGDYDECYVVGLRCASLQVVVEYQRDFPELRMERLPKLELEWILRPPRRSSQRELGGTPFTVVEHTVGGYSTTTSDEWTTEESDEGSEADPSSDSGL